MSGQTPASNDWCVTTTTAELAELQLIDEKDHNT